MGPIAIDRIRIVGIEASMGVFSNEITFIPFL